MISGDPISLTIRRVSVTEQNIGVIYPQTEVPPDPGWIREYCQAIEGLGFSHIVAYDHVLGIQPDPDSRGVGPYTAEDPFMELFVLFSYMASNTTRLGFCTGVLVLPQRQTALVAKQAACLDLLSGGRLRLGVGVGWNRDEFTGLNASFHDRGDRVEEQIELLRRLWNESVIDYSGQWHTLPSAGINPLPGRKIPIWIGGGADRVLRRIARMGDGWLPNVRTAEDALPYLEKLDGYLDEFGRSRDQIGLEGRVLFGDGDLDQVTEQVQGWLEIGATHVSINTMRSRLQPPQHLEALERVAAHLGIR
jgi:probable F420-dependent oxidoreductase